MFAEATFENLATPEWYSTTLREVKGNQKGNQKGNYEMSLSGHRPSSLAAVLVGLARCSPGAAGKLHLGFFLRRGEQRTLRRWQLASGVGIPRRRGNRHSRG